MFRPRSENVETYLNWVAEGVNCDSSASQKFEVDGRPYVFSALRPEPAPAGSLHLRTLNMTLLNVLVCGMIVLLGLLLIRAKVTTQIAGAILAIAVLMAVGVFFPLITEHLFSEALLITSLLIGLVWVVSDCGRWVQEIRRIRNDREQAREAMFQPVGLAVAGGNVPIEPDDEPNPPANDSANEGGAQ